MIKTVSTLSFVSYSISDCIVVPSTLSLILMQVRHHFSAPCIISLMMNVVHCLTTLKPTYAKVLFNVHPLQQHLQFFLSKRRLVSCGYALTTMVSILLPNKTTILCHQLTIYLTKFKSVRFFLVIDLKNVFNLIHIQEVFQTYLGLFKYTVMPFGLTNDLRIF